MPSKNPLPKILVSQADRILERFGGPKRLHKLLVLIGRPRNLSTIYRWTYPHGVNSGTGGLIPTEAWPDLLLAAKIDGIILTPEEMVPLATYRKVPREKVDTVPEISLSKSE